MSPQSNSNKPTTENKAQNSALGLIVLRHVFIFHHYVNQKHENINICLSAKHQARENNVTVSQEVNLQLIAITTLSIN